MLTCSGAEQETHRSSESDVKLESLDFSAGWLYWLQGLCGIICLLKSGISVLHLITASKNMAAIDAAEREKASKMK